MAAGEGFGQVQRVSLNGPWRHWVDLETHAAIEVPFSLEPVGTLATYERVFSLPAGTPTGLVLLHFEGLVGKADIWLNATHLGQRGSYLPFDFDVTSIINVQGENSLVVVIDDRRDVGSVPYADIPWVFYSGISRDVELICADAAVLVGSRPQYDLAADLSEVTGTMTVEARATPGLAVSLSGALLRRVDDEWQVAASLPVVEAITSLEGVAAAALPFELAAPTLWSPEQPTLYYLYTLVGVGGAVVDERMVPTGFRDIRVQGQDILLNGSPLLLKGVSYHGIYPGTGHVAGQAQIREDLVRIKAAGANYIRTIHYPQDPQLLDIADEVGLLVSEEVPAWANFWDLSVQQQLYALLEGMIWRDMHHPCVILWVTGNARAYPMPYAQQAQQLAKSLDRNRLCSYVIDNDQYDPATIAEDVAFVQAAGLDLYMKITWWFYYVEYLQDAWANFPRDLPIVITEFGREGNDREPIVVDDQQHFWVKEDRQADAVVEMLEAWRPHLPQYDAEAHITGLVYYNFQDIDWPDIQRYLPNHIGSIHHGLVYDDRVPKQVLDAIGGFYTGLPDHFVGLPEPHSEQVERRFAHPAGLGAAVNGVNRDSGPSLSADGHTLYFASDGPDYVGLPKLFLSRRSDQGWAVPELVDMPQEPEPFAFRRSPCISADKQSLYFARAVVSGIYVANTRIRCSHRQGGAWQASVDLGDVVNYPDAGRTTSDPCISADGQTLFFSSDRPGGLGRTDLWMSRLADGAWSAPVNLGPGVNTAAGESEPSLTRDGHTLYFSSDRPGGVGSSDLWLAHLVNGEWTAVRNLGPEVNSPGAEREPEVSADGREILFTGIRSGGLGLSDLWAARRIRARGDVDNDGDVDAVDFAVLQRCLSRPDVAQPAPICEPMRLDEDSDVDQDDLAILVACAAGPGVEASWSVPCR